MGITLLRAARSTRILLLRRNPSDTVHLMLWEGRGTTVAHGSWFHGAILQDRCDLSDGGEWFVYAARGNQHPHFWSGLSPVPELSLEHRWDLGVNWDFYGTMSGGGGYFTGPRRYVPCSTYGPEYGVPPKKTRGGSWTVAPVDGPSHRWIPRPMATRLVRDGWTLHAPTIDPYQDGPLDGLYERLRAAPSAVRTTAGVTQTMSVLHHPTHGRRYLHYCDLHPDLFDADVRSVVPTPAGFAVARGDAVTLHDHDLRPTTSLDLGDPKPPWAAGPAR